MFTCFCSVPKLYVSQGVQRWCVVSFLNQRLLVDHFYMVPLSGSEQSNSSGVTLHNGVVYTARMSSRSARNSVVVFSGVFDFFHLFVCCFYFLHFFPFLPGERWGGCWSTV